MSFNYLNLHLSLLQVLEVVLEIHNEVDGASMIGNELHFF